MNMVKKDVTQSLAGYKVRSVPAAQASEQSRGGPATVSFRGATKRYGDATSPAVDHLDLEVDAGEICVLVGPSGCGKTTSMRMVNRMIELSEGDILIGGESVKKRDAAKLRREIGYVIQQIGLFPHRTIAQNIATVPQLLGWDKEQIRHRTSELLDLVGLDPDLAGRYPVQLSGGQQQRVGVARALAVDPPVMLMDEPFGAIDPIARERLQNEFLRLQADIRKTVIFVTHDIDEAIKMGDKIAIMKQHGRVEQYATPAEILMAPANEFVEDFVGADRALKRLSLLRVGDIDLWKAPNARPGQSTAEVRAELDHPDVEVPYALLVDEGARPFGWRTQRDLAGDTVPATADAPLGPVLETGDVMRDALADLLQGESMYAPVVDHDGAITGILSIEIISEYLASPDAKTDERGAVERPLGAERESEILADE